MASQPVLPNEVLIRRGGACAPQHKARSPKRTSLLERLLVSKFRYRYPVLYGLFFELRSFLHSIQPVRKQGGTRSLEIGSVFQQQDAQPYLVRNMRTQARTRDIQKLLSDCPSLSAEDCHLFLRGLDAGQEYSESFDTAGSCGDMQS
jgi:hypothetical protein